MIRIIAGGFKSCPREAGEVRFQNPRMLRDRRSDRNKKYDTLQVNKKRRSVNEKSVGKCVEDGVYLFCVGDADFGSRHDGSCHAGL